MPISLKTVEPYQINTLFLSLYVFIQAGVYVLTSTHTQDPAKHQVYILL